MINSDTMKPMFGICMGNQMAALAAGACTYKLPLGNRYTKKKMHNVSNKTTERCFKIVQNSISSIKTMR